MSATKDPLNKIMFSTKEAAIKYCGEYHFDAVLESKDPIYAHKPYFCVKYVKPEEMEEVKKRHGENIITGSVTDDDDMPKDDSGDSSTGN